MSVLRSFVRAWRWWLIPLLLAASLWIAASVAGNRDRPRDDAYSVA